MYTLFAHHTSAHTSSMTSVGLFAVLGVLAGGVAILSYVKQRKDK